MDKKWINMKNKKQEETVDVVESKEEKEMGFFEKHKAGIIVGAVTLVTAIAAGIFVAINGDDGEADEDLETEIFDADTGEAVNEG